MILFQRGKVPAKQELPFVEHFLGFQLQDKHGKENYTGEQTETEKYLIIVWKNSTSNPGFTHNPLHTGVCVCVCSCTLVSVHAVVYVCVCAHIPRSRHELQCVCRGQGTISDAGPYHLICLRCSFTSIQFQESVLSLPPVSPQKH